MNTSGNTILITGAASGIGLEIDKQFSRKNNTVIMTDKTAHKRGRATICCFDEGCERSSARPAGTRPNQYHTFENTTKIALITGANKGLGKNLVFLMY